MEEVEACMHVGRGILAGGRVACLQGMENRRRYACMMGRGSNGICWTCIEAGYRGASDRIERRQELQLPGSTWIYVDVHRFPDINGCMQRLHGSMIYLVPSGSTWMLAMMLQTSTGFWKGWRSHQSTAMRAAASSLRAA